MNEFDGSAEDRIGRARHLFESLLVNEPYPEKVDVSEQDDWITWIEASGAYAGMLRGLMDHGRTDPAHLRQARELRAAAGSSATRWPERWSVLTEADRLLDQAR